MFLGGQNIHNNMHVCSYIVETAENQKVRNCPYSPEICSCHTVGVMRAKTKCAYIFSHWTPDKDEKYQGPLSLNELMRLHSTAHSRVMQISTNVYRYLLSLDAILLTLVKSIGQIIHKSKVILSYIISILLFV